MNCARPRLAADFTTKFSPVARNTNTGLKASLLLRIQVKLELRNLSNTYSRLKKETGGIQRK